jgi:hypothetical protein
VGGELGRSVLNWLLDQVFVEGERRFGPNGRSDDVDHRRDCL